ncbi:hypothetical protein [Rhizobium sp. WYCCWR 11128]|uniref:hypothetical protein n=1 Tax=Rhizobium sp. WYCCWR 11128 TaxID=2749832 RepID=UPI0015D24A2A|nr:hypothetical protein [Rhizobium sp. WYCCWR 11128]NYT33902.1 hypothetical protein [Rhizobium sp. WYCCWR 11128]
MARKKNPDAELKDQRIPIMMSPSELERIDDWSFKRRIRSRGEAIRRLCQLGLRADVTIDRLLPAIVSASEAHEATKRRVLEALDKADSTDEAKALFRRELVSRLTQQVKILATLTPLLVQARTLPDKGEVHEYAKYLEDVERFFSHEDDTVVMTKLLEFLGNSLPEIPKDEPQE